MFSMKLGIRRAFEFADYESERGERGGGGGGGGGVFRYVLKFWLYYNFIINTF